MYLDALVLVILGGFLLLGLKRGFILEFLSMFGIVVNLYIAYRLAPILSVELKKYFNTKEPVYDYIISFLIVFLIISFVIFILEFLLKNKEQSFLLTIFGGGVGLFKGLVVVTLALTFFNVVQEKTSRFDKLVDKSIALEYFSNNSEELYDYLPKNIKEELEKVKQKKSIRNHLKKLLGD